MDFAKLDQLDAQLVQLWPSEGRPSEEEIQKGNAICQKIISLCKSKNGKTNRKYIIQDEMRIITNMAWFCPHLNRLSTKSVAIVAPSKIPISPELVKSGRAGAGSEEMLVELAQRLAKKGCNVVVFTNIDPDVTDAIPCSNPRYLPYSRDYSSTFLPTSPEFLSYLYDFIIPLEDIPGTGTSPVFDYVIVSRDTGFKRYQSLGRKVIFWSHDTPVERYSIDGLDGIFVLSKDHSNDHVRLVPEIIINKIPMMNGGNGVDTKLITDKKKKRPHSCIWASNYGRGLGVILSIWPVIKEQFPDATLDICYGRETWGVLNKTQLSNIVKMIESLKSKGVKERGMLPHDKLTDLLETSSIFVYPCNVTGETFCIVAAKAQLAGCIPVTSRVGALDEIVLHKMRTISEEESKNVPSPKTLPHRETVEEYAKTPEIHQYGDFLLEVLSMEETLDRSIYRRHAERWNWGNVIGKWEELFKKVDKR